MDAAPFLVASLADIIRSKRAAGRPRDLAVVDVLERTDGQAKAEAKNGHTPRAPRRPGA